MAQSFAIRLKWCMQHGMLSVSDIARWTRRTYPTVTNWVRGAIPRGPRAPSVLKRLAELETAIKKKRGFPVPDEIGHFDRPAYIERLRDGHSKKLSRPNSSRKRVANRSRKRSAAKPARKRNRRVATKRAETKAPDHPPSLAAE